MDCIVFTHLVRLPPKVTPCNHMAGTASVPEKQSWVPLEKWTGALTQKHTANREFPDNKVHGAYMGSIWVLSTQDGPHVGPMSLAIRVVYSRLVIHNCSTQHGQPDRIIVLHLVTAQHLTITFCLQSYSIAVTQPAIYWHVYEFISFIFVDVGVQ